MSDEYEQMLDTALENMPKIQNKSERFEVPKVKGHLQGNKTVISNFSKIADTIGRPADRLLKYVLKELATPGTKKGNFVIIGSKMPASRINEKIQQFVDDFVICKECGKPDTKVKKEGSVSVLRCQACGARYPIKIKF
ncbi:translation initiation factor IF-2 subunit beta [Candidatus Woesearchaeota archaeon]|nr:translation initiation factor IF-2 subunit beta [Candidatus Woesearchaeota archaeon]